MSPRLVAITDRTQADARVTLERFSELAALARPGSVVFQLRDLGLSTPERMEFGRALAAIVRERGQLFIVNDRIDVALVLRADGVHLGETAVETSDARRLLGARALVTRACHDPNAVAAVDADAVLLSPILEARKDRPALGLGVLRRVRAAGPRARIIALGGVSPEHVEACLSAGADGVAVIGAVLRDARGPDLLRALGIER